MVEVDDDIAGAVDELEVEAGDIGFMLCDEVAAVAGLAEAELPPEPLPDVFEQPASAIVAAIAKGTANIIFIWLLL